MGFIKHSALVVVGDDIDDAIREAHKFASRAVAKSGSKLEIVTPVVGPVVNGTCSFAILPDGSKEWWDTSDAIDEARQAVIDWLNSYRRGRMGYCPFDWIEVHFGGDFGRETQGHEARTRDSEASQERP